MPSSIEPPLNNTKLVILRQSIDELWSNKALISSTK